MVLCADYAKNAYGNVGYGVRAPESYAANVSEFITTADNFAVLTAAFVSIAEIYTSNDLLAPLFSIHTNFTDIVFVTDPRFTGFAVPVDIMQIENNGRSIAIANENRSAAGSDSRKVHIPNEPRNVKSKPEIRNF